MHPRSSKLPAEYSEALVARGFTSFSNGGAGDRHHREEWWCTEHGSYGVDGMWVWAYYDRPTQFQLVVRKKRGVKISFTRTKTTDLEVLQSWLTVLKLTGELPDETSL